MGETNHKDRRQCWWARGEEAERTRRVREDDQETSGGALCVRPILT